MRRVLSGPVKSFANGEGRTWKYCLRFLRIRIVLFLDVSVYAKIAVIRRLYTATTMKNFIRRFYRNFFAKNVVIPVKDLRKVEQQQLGLQTQLIQPRGLNRGKAVGVVTALVNSDRDTNLISFNLPAWKKFVAAGSGRLSLEHEDVFHLATYQYIDDDVFYISTITPDKDLPLAPDLGCPWTWHYETCIFKGRITSRGEYDLDKAQEILTARFLTELGAREYHQFASEHLEEILAKFGYA